MSDIVTSRSRVMSGVDRQLVAGILLHRIWSGHGVRSIGCGGFAQGAIQARTATGYCFLRLQAVTVTSGGAEGVFSFGLKPIPST